MSTIGRVFPRDVALEEQFARVLPELVMTVTPEQLAMIAATAMVPRPVPSMGLTHLHAPHVSVREQAGLLVDRLRGRGVVDFRELVSDADSTLVVVARFLAVLELYRDGMLSLQQQDPFAELTVRWAGPAEGSVQIDDEFDDELDGREQERDG